MYVKRASTGVVKARGEGGGVATVFGRRPPLDLVRHGA